MYAGVSHACTHAHTCMHACTCMLNMLNMDASMSVAICNFYTCINVCVCMCMHVYVHECVCWDTPHMPPDAPPPTCPLTRATGSTKYKARHAHKHLYMVLPKYSKIQVLPGITSCRLMKYNKQAIELNSLLINNMPKDGYE